ncbi:MAG: thiamine pyrophosphate-binding protein [Pseudomonadota bacterium]
MNNADLIVATLKSAGIRHGFGIPSGNVIPLMESMRTGGIDFVLTAHEGTAGFAADVSARVSGRPGFAVATLGPGATNLATGVGNAYLDRSPMIAITCNLHTPQLGRRIQMYIDHHALFAPITKGSFRLEHGAIGETLARALQLAMTEPCGPVHLDLPEDVALQPTTESVPVIPAPIPLPAPAGTSIDLAHDLIAKAKRPLAIIGANAMRMEGTERLAKFVEHYRIPFATTTMAKGLIDEAHALSVGCIERALRQMQRRFFQRADLVIGMGYDTIEVEYEAWLGDRRLVHIDIESADVDASVNVVSEVLGDVGQSLDALIAMPPGDSTWTDRDVADYRAEYQTTLRPAAATFSPHQAIDVVREVLPDDGVLAFDVGAHTHQIAGQWRTPKPRSFLITNGWSSMGFALPAAIAAKLAEPERPVVCVLGDGCFQMTCGELATAKRMGLNVPVVVLDDRWLGLIKVKQERRQITHYGTELQREPYGEPPAHYFGVPAVGARDANALRAALIDAFARSGPSVIEAVVDAEQYSHTVFD